MDVAKAVRMAVDTGKVVIGSERSKKTILRGEGKMVLLASNCPRGISGDIERYAKLSSIPSFRCEKNAMELGTVCGKPFPITVLTVLEEGNSNILEVMTVFYQVRKKMAPQPEKQSKTEKDKIEKLELNTEPLAL